MYKGKNSDSGLVCKRSIPRAVDVYVFPRDKAVFSSVFWSLQEAARAWGVPYHTARRWALLRPEAAIWVLVKCRGSKRARWKLCIWRGIGKTPIRHRGNPRFRESVFQRRMAARSVAKRARATEDHTGGVLQ